MTAGAKAKSVKVAIFASGTGSNAMALIKKSKTLSQLEISFVLSDKANAPVLPKAQAEGVRTYLVEKKQDRAAHETEILTLLKEHKVDWILLAGYMRMISADFLSTFASWHQGQSQIVNIHPSLLPAYPGVDSIARAHKEGAPHTGVTLHFVDDGMDTGTVIRQEKLAVHAEETLEQLASRMHRLEHQIYTEFLESLSTHGRKTIHFEENP